MYDLPLMFLRDPNVPAFVLLVIVLHHFGTQCFDWEPEVLRWFIKDDYGVELTDLQSDKLQAAMLVLTTDQFESQWQVFETVCHLFCGVPDELETCNPVEAEEIAMAMAEVDIIKHTAEDSMDFDDEVKVYAGKIFHDYGLKEAPKLLPTAIMPACVECDDKEKQDALSELYDERKKTLESLARRLAEMHTE